MEKAKLVIHGVMYTLLTTLLAGSLMLNWMFWDHLIDMGPCNYKELKAETEVFNEQNETKKNKKATGNDNAVRGND